MTRKPASNTSNHASESREDRLKSALKANMSRRKAQARARAEAARRGAGNKDE